MTAVLPELRALPPALLDGELVAWKGSEPYFPLVCRRVLNRDMTVPLTFVIFDVLRSDGADLTAEPYLERRRTLTSLKLDGLASTTSETFDDGPALFTAVCELGFEGIVAKEPFEPLPSERSRLRHSRHGRTQRSFEQVQVAREPARVQPLQICVGHPTGDGAALSELN